MFHGVTIGGRDQIFPDGRVYKGFPELKNNVWVGPHAIIVGGIVIGEVSRIAGGTFVTKSVPPYSTVIGNTARVVKIRRIFFKRTCKY